MAKKGVPKKDGSGRGTRANRGRGGCKTTRKTGKGKSMSTKARPGWRRDSREHALAAKGISTKKAAVPACDDSKIDELKEKDYTFFSDAGHAWLRVPHQAIIDAGIEDEISPYSYLDNSYVYLEEDVDAALFLGRLFSDFGEEWREWNRRHIDEKYVGDYAKIRSFDDYNAAKFRRAIRVKERI